MRIENRKKYIAVLMTILCIIMLFPQRISAVVEDPQRETVRVGFFEMNGYHMQDEDGNRSGYGYDTLRLMARYWDVDYEYIGYLPDYFRKLADYCGISYQFILCDSREEYVSYGTKGKQADLAIDARFPDDNLPESKDYGVTAPYITIKSAKVYRKDFNGEIKTVATVDQGDADSIEDVYAPDAKKIIYPSREDAMEAVKAGDADMTLKMLVQLHPRALLILTGVMLLLVIIVGVQWLKLRGKNNELKVSFDKINRDKHVLDKLCTDYTAVYHVELNSGEFETLKIMRSSNADAAKRESEMKTRFLATMSHDIRTPLNGIIGLVNLAEQHAEDTKMLKEIRDKMMKSLKYLVSLVNDVLDMNKIQSGDFKSKEIIFDGADMMRKILRIYDQKAVEKGIRLEVDWEKCSVRHPILLGNPVYFGRILASIMDNAIKFSSVDSTITVWGREDILENDQAVLTIWCKDQGIGMSEEFIEHAFDMFAQEKESSRSQYEGTGLGLTIAKALADKMGGTIEFQSKQGVGTTAIIKIPFKLGSQDISSKTTNYDNVSVEGMQVLVVDDNELNVEIAKCMLENSGMKVTCAADGQEAVELFEKSEPGYYGAIFMDVMMPRMNGLEATKTIRNMKRSDAWNVPIIAISANAFIEDILNSKQAGRNAHLAKPLDVNKLLEALKKCLAENSELKIREDL